MAGFAMALQPDNLLFAFRLRPRHAGRRAARASGRSRARRSCSPSPSICRRPPPSSCWRRSITAPCTAAPSPPCSSTCRARRASAITCLDGYQMAKQGRAGPALARRRDRLLLRRHRRDRSASSSLAPPLTSLALQFGPPEFFALMLVGLSLVTGLAGNSIVRALISAVVGPSHRHGRHRSGRGRAAASPSAASICSTASTSSSSSWACSASARSCSHVEIAATATRARLLKSSSLRLSREDVRRSVLADPARHRHRLLPRPHPRHRRHHPDVHVLRRGEAGVSKTPEKFGTGMIEGVAGPETANNAYANAALIPLFTLGIPGSPTVAIIMGAFMMNGIDARAVPVPRPCRARLGRHRELLHRQRDPARAEPAADPALGEDPRDPAGILFTFVLGFCVVGA